METFMNILFNIAVVLILFVIALLIARYTRTKKRSEDKLLAVDGAFFQDDKVQEGEVYLKNLATGKSHRFNKFTDSPRHYYIASITKLFTHAIIFQLLDEGVLEREAPISAYLPKDRYEGIRALDGKDTSANIRIGDLIDQTSGLQDYETDYKADGKTIIDEVIAKDRPVTFDDALAIQRKLAVIPEAKQEKKVHYSNFNALLLGEIAETVTGLDLMNVFNKRIFEPIGMKDTFLAREGQEVMGIYNLKDKLNPIQYIQSAPAAGGLVSTSEDMMTFMTAFIQGDLFDAKHLTASPTKPIQFFPLKYGNGMMEVKMNPLMSPLFESPRIIGHSGSTGSFAFYDTKRQVVIVGTTNQLKGNPYSYIYTYLDGMVGKEDR